MTVRRIINSLLTEEDDQTPDWSRITWIALSFICLLALLLFLAIGVVVAVKGTQFDFGGFGTGLAAVLAGAAAVQTACGAALAMKFRSGA